MTFAPITPITLLNNLYLRRCYIIFAINDKFSSAVVQFSDSVLKPTFAVTSDTYS